MNFSSQSIRRDFFRLAKMAGFMAVNDGTADTLASGDRRIGSRLQGIISRLQMSITALRSSANSSSPTTASQSCNASSWMRPR